MNFNWFETCLFAVELRRTIWKLLLYLQLYLDFRSYFEATGSNYFNVFCKILLQSILLARIISWSPNLAQKEWKPKIFTASHPDVNCSLVATSLLGNSEYQTDRNINRTPLAIFAQKKNYKVASLGNNQLLNEFGQKYWVFFVNLTSNFYMLCFPTVRSRPTPSKPTFVPKRINHLHQTVNKTMHE